MLLPMHGDGGAPAPTHPVMQPPSAPKVHMNLLSHTGRSASSTTSQTRGMVGVRRLFTWKTCRWSSPSFFVHLFTHPLLDVLSPRRTPVVPGESYPYQSSALPCVPAFPPSSPPGTVSHGGTVQHRLPVFTAECCSTWSSPPQPFGPSQHYSLLCTTLSVLACPGPPRRLLTKPVYRLTLCVCDESDESSD